MKNTEDKTLPQTIETNIDTTHKIFFSGFYPNNLVQDGSSNGHFKITLFYYLQDFYGSSRISHEGINASTTQTKEKNILAQKSNCILPPHVMITV